MTNFSRSLLIVNFYLMSLNQKNGTRKLRKLNIDLPNYFSNTVIPQLFVDSDLVLRICTPPAMEHFSITYDHVGQEIDWIKDNLGYPQIVEEIKMIISSRSRVLEKEVQTLDGRWFQMNMVPYVEHEVKSVNGVIITFIDITRRLNAIKELEKLNSEHETLMFALSHDIRQPIAAITLLADVLTMAHAKKDSQQFEKWIKNLKQSSRVLTSLVDDFTTDDQEIGKEQPLEQSVNIPEICNDVLTALKGEIKLHRVKVVRNFQVSEIVFPRNNLRSIVYNLLHNAIKYRDPEKILKIEITTELAEGFLVLSIADNGPGIAREHQKKVFEKFSRFREDVKGTGMGLYIARKMMESNGGMIKLERRPGGGALFRVFFKNADNPKEGDQKS